MTPNEPLPPPETRRPSEPSTLSLAELTEQAGVTVRTVRYYIAEGLLPPPVAAGPQSHYTAAHRDRLRLIARMKDAYLPLREIRRRLAGLNDTAVRAALAEDTGSQRQPSPASDYLDQLLGAPGSRADPSRARPSPADQQPSLREDQPDAYPLSAALIDPGPGTPAPEPPRPLAIGVATPLTPVPAPPLVDEAAPESWRRVRLADDAELLIRESSYQQRQDRIDWLIRWARRVFR